MRGLGYEILDPWTLTDAAKIAAVQAMPLRAGPAGRVAAAEPRRSAPTTARRSTRADGVVAMLDGADVDSGTAAEIGYAFARGKLIVGYRGDFRLSADNEGGMVNLQVEYFIRESGGTIVKRYEDLERALASLEGGSA